MWFVLYRASVHHETVTTFHALNICAVDVVTSTVGHTDVIFIVQRVQVPHVVAFHVPTVNPVVVPECNSSTHVTIPPGAIDLTIT